MAHFCTPHATYHTVRFTLQTFTVIVCTQHHLRVAHVEGAKIGRACGAKLLVRPEQASTSETEAPAREAAFGESMPLVQF